MLRYLLLVYALIYMGSRGITKFFIKLLVKKVAPRTFVKAADMAPLVIEVGLQPGPGHFFPPFFRPS